MRAWRSRSRASSTDSASPRYLWRSRFGGMSVLDAMQTRVLETENGRLKTLLAESVLKNEVIREVLRKKW
jgi:putative transposase